MKHKPFGELEIITENGMQTKRILIESYKVSGKFIEINIQPDITVDRGYIWQYSCAWYELNDCRKNPFDSIIGKVLVVEFVRQEWHPLRLEEIKYCTSEKPFTLLLKDNDYIVVTVPKTYNDKMISCIELELVKTFPKNKIVLFPGEKTEIVGIIKNDAKNSGVSTTELVEMFGSCSIINKSGSQIMILCDYCDHPNVRKLKYNETNGIVKCDKCTWETPFDICWNNDHYEVRTGKEAQLKESKQ